MGWNWLWFQILSIALSKNRKKIAISVRDYVTRYPMKMDHFLIYSLPSLSAPQLPLIATKLASFMNQSITIVGNPTMSSIEIDSHFQVGTSSDYNSCIGQWCSNLTLQQVKHPKTESTTSFFMSHQKFLRRSLYVFIFPWLDRVWAILGFTRNLLFKFLDIRHAYSTLKS